MSEEQSIVYVVDDDPSVLKSIERLLRSAGYEVRAFSSALEFMDSELQDVPGCLILDIEMPELSGLELQERLSRSEVRFPIIFITGHGTVPVSVQAMKAGAVDFLQKPFQESELLEILPRAIAADRQLKSEEREMRILRERLKSLTHREIEVFVLVATGKPNKVVAFDLGTSEKTIKVHRGRVMEKLCAQSLADLVRFAEKLGLSSPEV